MTTYTSWPIRIEARLRTAWQWSLDHAGDILLLAWFVLVALACALYSWSAIRR